MTLTTRFITSTLLTVVAVIALSLSANQASASLLNGGFETDDASGFDVYGADSWAAFESVFTTATVFRTGDQSLQTYGPYNGIIGAGSVATQELPAEPGQTWVGEIWAQNSSLDPLDDFSDTFGVYKIDFLNANGNLVEGLGFPEGTPLAGFNVFESEVQINGSTPLDEWTLLGVGTAPAPEGTVWARAVIVKVSLFDLFPPGSIFWDDASLVIGTAIPEPSTYGLVALYGMAMAVRRRRG